MRAVRGSGRRLSLAVAIAVVAALAVPPQASAIHLFPLTPVFDPLGHDCAQVLEADPGDSAASVAVFGFNYVDGEANGPVTTIAAGESVTWNWVADHCHSVTFGDGSGTYGADGFQPPGQQQLVRNGPGGASFTQTFDEPGTYQYLCVHHASVGMHGAVVVTE